MRAIAHGGCTDTVRESALKVCRKNLLYSRGGGGGGGGGLEPHVPGSRTRISIALGFSVRRSNNNNNNVHISCAHKRPERSHDTY